MQKQITLNASEIRELGRIKLTVGALTEMVEVTAAATPVQTASSENASMVDFDQMKHITVRGRDLMSLLQTLPGVNLWNQLPDRRLQRAGQQRNGEPVRARRPEPQWHGQPANYTVDGVTGMDMAGDSLTTFSPQHRRGG